jgi:hypothetical protein|tara:strand:+ start:156 stop:794 length:639 start_codon:yes stop_codon:yes gene_type:complete
MECSTKTKILRVLNLVVILSLCFWVKYKNDKAKEMIQWNTKIINSIGIVSFTQSLNADVLMDIIAELDKDDYGTAGGVFASFQEDPRPMPQKQPMPEGMEEPYVQQSFSKFKADKDGSEVVSATFGQVIEDLQRIDMSVRAFASNNLFQKQSLDLIYKKLTEGDIKLQKVDEEGQEIYYIIQEDRYEEEPVKDIPQEELDNFEWLFVDLESL